MSTAVSGTQSSLSSTYSTSTSTTKKASDEKLNFLNLLTLQLKSQNPLKPYDNQEFASQLAQFSQLEQLTDIKSLLEEQTSSYQTLSQTMQNTALPGLLGKNSKALWSQAEFDGENPLKIGYNLSSACTEGEIVVKNESGSVIRTIDLSGMNLKSGDHTYEWDGKDDAGNTVTEGKYSFSVSACNSSGSTFTPDTYTYGKIESVKFTSDGTKLVINGVEVPLSYVSDISV